MKVTGDNGREKISSTPSKMLIRKPTLGAGLKIYTEKNASKITNGTCTSKDRQYTWKLIKWNLSNCILFLSSKTNHLKSIYQYNEFSLDIIHTILYL